jgi:cyclopropane fatty-acyl-phospholipid synthase-like methyltransferase
MSESNTSKVLAYWDRNASSFDAIYTGKKPGWARFLDKSLRRDMYQRFDWVMKNSGDLNGKSVCDLGCGTGRYVIAYAQSGAQRVLGLDGSASMVQQASSLIQQAGSQGNAEVQEYLILNCPENEVFDITIAVGVFDYIQNAVPYLEKIRRITGSRFLSTFPTYWTYRMPIRRVRLGLLGCPVYFYTAKQIRALHEKAGFTCERIERLGAIYCVLATPKGNPQPVDAR